MICALHDLSGDLYVNILSTGYASLIRPSVSHGSFMSDIQVLCVSSLRANMDTVSTKPGPPFSSNRMRARQIDFYSIFEQIHPFRPFVVVALIFIQFGM